MGVVLIAALPPTHARVGGIVGGNPTAHVPPTSRTCGLDNRKYLEFCSFASPWRVSAHRSAALEPLSGRQDLNLRPPGPQPEGSGVAQLIRPVFIGSRATEFLWVALKLDPKLDPKRVFVCRGMTAPGNPGHGCIDRVQLSRGRDRTRIRADSNTTTAPLSRSPSIRSEVAQQRRGLLLGAPEPAAEKDDRREAGLTCRE